MNFLRESARHVTRFWALIASRYSGIAFCATRVREGSLDERIAIPNKYTHNIYGEMFLSGLAMAMPIQGAAPLTTNPNESQKT